MCILRSKETNSAQPHSVLPNIHMFQFSKTPQTEISTTPKERFEYLLLFSTTRKYYSANILQEVVVRESRFHTKRVKTASFQKISVFLIRSASLICGKLTTSSNRLQLREASAFSVLLFICCHQALKIDNFLVELLIPSRIDDQFNSTSAPFYLLEMCFVCTLLSKDIVFHSKFSSTLMIMIVW